MSSNDAAQVASFLNGDPDMVDAVTTWVRLSTWSFRDRLQAEWEDTQQQALLEVTDALRRGSFRGRGSLKAYVRRIAATTCLDRLRWRRRWRWVGIEGTQLPSARESPDERALEHERLEILNQVLAAIPEECQKLWQMVLASLSYREMSERTGVSEGTLRTRVFRCRKQALQIRDQLAEKGNIGWDQTPR